MEIRAFCPFLRGTQRPRCFALEADRREYNLTAVNSAELALLTVRRRDAAAGTGRTKSWWKNEKRDSARPPSVPRQRAQGRYLASCYGRGVKRIRFQATIAEKPRLSEEERRWNRSYTYVDPSIRGTTCGQIGKNRLANNQDERKYRGFLFFSFSNGQTHKYVTNFILNRKSELVLEKENARFRKWEITEEIHYILFALPFERGRRGGGNACKLVERLSDEHDEELACDISLLTSSRYRNGRHVDKKFLFLGKKECSYDLTKQSLFVSICQKCATSDLESPTLFHFSHVA